MALPILHDSKMARIVTLAEGVPVVSMTASQANALNRLGRQGWRVDIEMCRLASDGVLEGEMSGESGPTLAFGIDTAGGVHT
jgi:hypothetical protein